MVCPLAQSWRPTTGVYWAGLACFVCLATAICIVELQLWFNSDQTGWPLVVLGLMIRMAIPLGLCLIVLASLGESTAKLLGTCFVIVYPAVLLVETWLIVKLLEMAGNTNAGLDQER